MSGEPFVPYGPSHWGMLVIFFVGLAYLLRRARQNVSEDSESRFRRGFAIAFALNQLFFQVYSMLPGQFDLKKSLPFQFSDLAPIAAIIALWNGHPVAFSLAFFWGFTLTPHSLFTPVANHDFPHVDFFMYWNPHVLMLWASVYLTWGLRYRPTWRGYRTVYAISVTWLATMMVFNAAVGSNYLFVSRKPGSKTLLDWLGGWPWYVLVLVAMGCVIWGAMTWAWAGWPPRFDGPVAVQRPRREPVEP